MIRRLEGGMWWIRWMSFIVRIFTGNDPVSRFDPDGADDAYFNSDGSLNGVTERNWLFELFVGGHRALVFDDDGNVANKFSLTQQGLDVVNSSKFEGFWMDWQTSNEALRFNGHVRDAVSSYKFSDKTLFDYIVYESQDKDGRFLN